MAAIYNLHSTNVTITMKKKYIYTFARITYISRILNGHHIFILHICTFFSLDNYDVDERLQKDLADYISVRINRSRAIQTNITPSKLSRLDI